VPEPEMRSRGTLHSPGSAVVRKCPSENFPFRPWPKRKRASPARERQLPAPGARGGLDAALARAGRNSQITVKYMQVTSTNSTTGALVAAPQSTLPGQTLNQNDFLKLLVAQLSAQDPMNPVSNTDFAAQMAQFSTLQATQTMQKNLSGVESSQAVLQANSLLGRTVQVQSPSGAIDSGAVSAVTFQSGSPSLIVNGQSYNLSSVLSVSLPQP